MGRPNQKRYNVVQGKDFKENKKSVISNRISRSGLISKDWLDYCPKSVYVKKVD